MSIAEQAETSTDGGSLPPPDPFLGKSVGGNFEILSLLGEGAMGRVYLARQVSLDKRVAIKVLHKNLASDPKLAKRFHREARAASRLSHPSAVQVIDFGADEDGTLYIAMELLDGENLGDVIRRDVPFSPARIASLLGQVLDALSDAHDAGIVHRDLKPDNVVVLHKKTGGEERVKVCDFGIAKIQEAERDGLSAITVQGFVCGTPEYMAPEQARGEDIDARADLYAAGVMLYELLTGAVPFEGDTALGVITRALMDPLVAPRVRAPDLGIPESLDAVCLKAMSRQPADRYQTASEFARDLRAAVGALGPEANERLGQGAHAVRARFSKSAETLPAAPAIASSPSRARLVVLGVGVAVVLCGVSVAAYYATLPPPAPPAPRAPVMQIADPSETDPERGDTSELAQNTATHVEPAAPTPPPVETLETPPPDVAAPDRDRRRARPSIDPPPPEPAAPPPVPTEPVAPETPPWRVAFDEGRRLFLSNDVAGAITQFEEAARLSPRNPDVQKQLGRAFLRQGNVPRGVESYRRYLELAPSAPDRAIIERIIEQAAP